MENKPDNTSHQGLLYRILSINLREYLDLLGFSGAELDFGFSAHTKKGHDHTILVDGATNTWRNSGERVSNKTIFDIAEAFLDCTPREFLNRIKDYPGLPKSYNLNSFVNDISSVKLKFDFQNHIISSDDASAFFSTINLPMDFVNRHCYESKISFDKQPYSFNIITLQTHSNYNQFILFKAVGAEQDDSQDIVAINMFLKPAHHFIDNGAENIDVFCTIADLLTKQYEYERLGIKPPNQLILAGMFGFENAREVMEKHKSINLYLPNDPVADYHKAYANWLSPKYKDFSPTYKQYEQLSIAHANKPDNGQLKGKRHGRGL